MELPSRIRIVEAPWSEAKPEGWTRFVCFSDTHGLHGSIPSSNCPPADVLLHGGDFTDTGQLEQVESFGKWLEAYPAAHKIVIAGNHDMTFDEDYYLNRGAARFHRQRPYDCKKARGLLAASTYLEDSSTEVCGYRIYGSPWQPAFCDWAFNLPRGEECRKKWEAIPKDVDILLTHGPPHGYGDLTSTNVRAGCADLRTVIEQLGVPVSLCGHIHEGYGCLTDDVTLYINASTCTLRYKATNPPVVFDAPPPPDLRAAAAAAIIETQCYKHGEPSKSHGSSRCAIE